MPSESKMERSHFMSPIDDSMRFETLRKSAALVMAKTWRRTPPCLHLRTRVRALSRFLTTSEATRRMGRS